jgi:hypothetical protein
VVYFSFGRVRNPVQPSKVYRENQAVLHNIRQFGGVISAADIRMPEMWVPVAQVENREVQDAAPAERFDANYLNGVYAPEVENDWAFEFQLTGGGS